MNFDLPGYIVVSLLCSSLGRDAVWSPGAAEKAALSPDDMVTDAEAPSALLAISFGKIETALARSSAGSCLGDPGSGESSLSEMAKPKALEPLGMPPACWVDATG